MASVVASGFPLASYNSYSLYQLTSMSHYWSLRCKQCEKMAGGINHGNRLYPEIAKDWFLLKQIIDLSDQLETALVDIKIFHGDDGEFIDFIRDHADHPIEMCSEYNDPPIDLDLEKYKPQ